MRSGRLVQNLSSQSPDEPYMHAEHDGIVHFPLGAASYIYEEEFFKPKLRELGLIPPSAHFPHRPRKASSDTTAVLASTSSDAPLSTDVESDSGISLTPEPSAESTSTLIIHIGAQPNNSPHAGTIVTFTLAFLVARAMKREYAKLRARAASEGMDLTGWADRLDVRIQLDLVDTAPDSAKTTTGPDGIVYQRSHRSTGAMCDFLPDYHALLAELSAFIGGEIEYSVTYQDALMRTPAMRDALRAIVLDRVRLASELAPQREAPAIRCACPAPDCGTADKHGILNEYEVTEDTTTITFHCPTHGPHSVRLEDPDERARIELNTPLRNLARTLVYLADTVASRPSPSGDEAGGPPTRVHMRVTGADYSGAYQESMLFRPLARLAMRMQPPLPLHEDGVWPVIMYAPLITDWSGAKLSKSLYVRDGAYKYLEDAGMDWLLEFRRMREEGLDRTVLYRMVETWVEKPTTLFGRNYTVDYVRLTYKKTEREKEKESESETVIGAKRKAEDEGEGGLSVRARVETASS
ncbi:hypothetical protein GSI_04414 [Ganoderma sinense ZZ0214-1]|uniref:Uncharacterized protein n=1 Tax=Ganoderma sinense ZZ0214-1 TaxID=1077348 RepID=A0A2G8SJ46_9APHY|nr:hypothetical protein GSI_04414 [Ganoderma sinense ZZ0214-1]